MLATLVILEVIPPSVCSILGVIPLGVLIAFLEVIPPCL